MINPPELDTSSKFLCFAPHADSEFPAAKHRSRGASHGLHRSFRILLLPLLLMIPCGFAIAASGDEPGAESKDRDGIIGSGETMDSTVLQTHGNPDRNPAADILSTHFVRDHIAAHAEAFKYLGSEEESFLAWPLPLSSHRKVVEMRKEVLRYNIVSKRTPRYVYDYDYVTRTVYVREGGTGGGYSDSGGYSDDKRGSAGKLVKRTVRTREVVNVRQVGYKTCRVKCPDPEGKYEEELTVPITKSIGVAVLPRGWHAANAQLAFTTIKAGLPADDPQIQLIYRSFNNLLFAYGIPDTTADVAWLAALYANLPQEDPTVKEWTARLASRLVAGAVQTGDRRGMWGPVCIHPEYVDEMVDYDAKYLAKYITPLQGEIRMEANESRKKRLQQDFNEKQKLYEDWQREYLTWAMAGSAANFPRKMTTLPAETENQRDLFFSYSLQVPGLVQDPYHFQFTDLESTCIALFALNEVHAIGALPEKTLVPLDQRKKPMGKPVDVAETLKACHETLRKLRLADGGWNSCYSGKFHNQCRNIPYSSVLPKNLYDAILPEEHWAYRLMGLAAMDYLAKVVGGSTAQRIREESASAHAGLIKSLLERSAPIDFQTAPGREILRYFLADVIGSRNPDSRFLWQMIGEMGLQESVDIEKLDPMEAYNSHSARAALEAEQKHVIANGSLLESWGMEADRADTMKMSGIRSLSERASITYFLAKGIRPPIFAAIKPGGPRPTLPALDYLMNSAEGGVSLNYFYVGSVDDIARYITAYFLVMEDSGETAFRQEDREKLGEYLGQGGTLVLLGLPGKGTDALQGMAADLLAGMGAESRVVDGDKRGSRCIEYYVNDRLAAIVVNSATEGEPKATYSKRLKVYKTLMQDKLPAEYLSNSYSLLQSRSTSGELTLTGVEWNNGEEGIGQ
jgi:hypothetical protein